jgi:hypothetical protein
MTLLARANGVPETVPDAFPATTSLVPAQTTLQDITHAYKYNSGQSSSNNTQLLQAIIITFL